MNVVEIKPNALRKASHCHEVHKVLSRLAPVTIAPPLQWRHTNRIYSRLSTFLFKDTDVINGAKLQQRHENKTTRHWPSCRTKEAPQEAPHCPGPAARCWIMLDRPWGLSSFVFGYLKKCQRGRWLGSDELEGCTGLRLWKQHTAFFYLNANGNYFERSLIRTDQTSKGFHLKSSALWRSVRWHQTNPEDETFRFSHGGSLRSRRSFEHVLQVFHKRRLIRAINITCYKDFFDSSVGQDNASPYSTQHFSTTVLITRNTGDTI